MCNIETGQEKSTSNIKIQRRLRQGTEKPVRAQKNNP